MSDALAVCLEHADSTTVREAVDKISFTYDGKVYCVAIRHGRLELWVRMSDLDIRPLHHNAIAIGRPNTNPQCPIGAALTGSQEPRTGEGE